MVARDGSVPITMSDFIPWWQQLETEYGDEIEVKMTLTDDRANQFVRITVTARDPAIGHKGHVTAEKSVIWPTGSHKTVLGALLWLFIGLDDEYTADDALAGLVSVR
jgi:hypothetical protein